MCDNGQDWVIGCDVDLFLEMLLTGIDSFEVETWSWISHWNMSRLASGKHSVSWLRKLVRVARTEMVEWHAIN